ncbi:TetR/AcrR family transcriptional regulator [Demequina sp. NBRC 110056]|uniref:TetR/AcrR family transcriptional regulator n=1 Tax=Demequina sp. NBRC 110056 TaxID=1570345 RepID=UPI0009FF1000|nr:TetR/AcrR family transcriptional regulator [Demequina sp. NBRC 110056]
MSHSIEPPRQRSDAQRNRESILEAAVLELERDPDVSLSSIGKRAGVGQGTLYRHFPDREALLWAVYGGEVTALADRAATLLESEEPVDALRAWLSALGQFALSKAGVGGGMRTHALPAEKSVRPGYAEVVRAIDELIDANHRAGSVRPDVTSSDLILLIAAIWQMQPGHGSEERIERLFDLAVLAIATPVR